ncbi:MAG: hypothetical protein JNJ45_04950 [Chthonomonas sp.]|nr:hypothetical protein [Chthonomonas sp.]
MAKFLISCIPILGLVGWQSTPNARTEIASLVQARNVGALRRFSGPELAKDLQAFDFLNLGGVYGGGSQGWAVVFVREPLNATEYAVVHTPTGMEDIGSQVFEFREGKLVRKIAEADRQGFRLVHHNFETVEFRPEKMELTVRDRFRMRREKPSSGSTILRLGSHLKVSDLRTSTGNKVPFAQGGGVVIFPSPSADQPELVIEYSGKINLPFIGGMTRQNEMSLAGDIWYPTLGRWPATYTAKLKFPRGWRAIAPGVAGPVVPGATQDEQTFRMDVANCFFSMSVGQYRSRSLKTPGLEIETASANMSEADMDLQNRVSAPVFAYLAKFKKYPFPKFTFLESQCMFGGALEAYSHATYEQNWLPDEEPHEPAHTWFGGIVPNTYLTSLWNESFASWFETHFKRENGMCPPAEARRAFIEFPYAAQSFERFPVARAGSEQGTDASDLGYNKGAYVLQMLETVIGPEKVVAAIQEFLRAHPAGEPAEWPDFEAACERVVGEDLSWFFDQWLRRVGSPRVKVRDATWTAGKLRVRFDWVGAGYRMPTEALLRFDTGPEIATRVTIPASGDLIIPTTSKPKLVALDPYNRLLRHRDPGEVPQSLSGQIGRFKRFVATGMSATEEVMGGKPRIGQRLTSIPSILKNVCLMVPATEPRIASYLRQEGVAVKGSSVTWRGTTVDMNRGGMILRVPKEDGWLIIVCGKPKLEARMNQAQFALFDELGRAVRTRTEPRTTGGLAVAVR